MRKIFLTVVGLFLIIINLTQAQDKFATIISNTNQKLSSDIMTPEVLWSFGRITELSVSPKEYFAANAKTNN